MGFKLSMAVFLAAGAPQVCAASDAASSVSSSFSPSAASATGSAASGSGSASSAAASATGSAASGSGSASSAAATGGAASGPTDARAVAEQRYREGTESLDRGDFEAARLAFVQAYALEPEPRYLLGLATAEAKGPHPIEAVAHLRQYLSLPTITPTERSAASLLMADAASKAERTASGASASPPAASGASTSPPAASSAWASSPEAPGASASPPAALGAPASPPAAPEESLTPNGKPLPTTKWIVAAGLVGGGLLSFGIAGAVSAAGANKASKEADLDVETGVCLQPPTTAACSALKSAADARAADNNIAIGFAAAGGALAVAGVLSLIFWPAAKSHGKTGFLAPLVTTRGAGAQWAQQF